MADSGAEQLQRLETLERISHEKIDELDADDRAAARRRRGGRIAIVRTDRGKDADGPGAFDHRSKWRPPKTGCWPRVRQEWQDARHAVVAGDVGRLDAAAAADRRGGGR